MRAFEAGFEIGAKSIAAGIVEAVLSSKLNELEPQLTRTATTCATWSSSSTPSQLKSVGCCGGDLDAGRGQELLDEMRAAGLPP